MICTNRRCRRSTTKIVCRVDKRGKARWGCPKCIQRLVDAHVRTGRKIWPAYEVYGVEKTIEKNHEWIESVSRRAAHMRRTAHHSRFRE